MVKAQSKEASTNLSAVAAKARRSDVAAEQVAACRVVLSPTLQKAPAQVASGNL
jgi:hypothetical protein